MTRLIFTLLLTLLFNIAATKAATRAAIAAENAVTDLERPHIFMEVPWAGLGKTTTSDGSQFFKIEVSHLKYQFVNYGRTPAQLLDIILRYPIVDIPDVPDALPIGTVPDRNFPIGVVAAPGHPHEETENPLPAYGTDIWAEVGAPNKKRLFFMGRARYEDIFGVTYAMGFCFVFDPLGSRYVRWGDKQYNYTHREDAKPDSLRARMRAARQGWRKAAHGRALLR
jgi:hypothetical protein